MIAVVRWASRGLLLALVLSSTGCGGCGAEPDTTAADAATPSSNDGGLRAESRQPTPLAPSVVAKRLNPSNLPVYDGQTAILEGNVYVRGPAAPQLDPPKTSTCKNLLDYRLFREGPADANGRRPLADAIVGVTGYNAFVPPKGDAVEVSVRDCMFDRRTVVLTLGQRIEVKNTEPLNSGVFYMPKLTKGAAPTDMVVAPGNSVKLYMNEPGRALMVDGMAHGHLYADVFVSLSALHIVTDKNGHFVLPGIPVGDLEVSVMHPAFDVGQVKTKLTFKPGETTHHDFEVTYVPKAVGDAGATGAAHADAGR